MPDNYTFPGFELLKPLPLTAINDIARRVRDPKYLVQPKENGTRRVFIRDGSRLYGLSRTLTEHPVPTNLRCDFDNLKGDFCIDGELLFNERFVALDILKLGKRDLRPLPYAKRLASLWGINAICPQIVPVETATTEADKLKLIERAWTQRREGVCFKLTTAPYRIGRNGQHLKLKFWKTITCRVTGVGENEGRNSATIACRSGREWREVGHVSLNGKCAVKEGDYIEVQYLYASGDRRLVQAQLLMVRDDVKPSDCKIESLVINSNWVAA